MSAGSTAYSSSYVDVFRAAPADRIRMIKAGVTAMQARRIIDDFATNRAAGFKALNLSVATVNRKAKQQGTLSPEESERVIGAARLLGQLQAIAQESGAPADFDSAAWMSRWLSEPLPALGGVPPLALLDTMEGQGVVSQLLSQIQSGAYA